MNWQKRKRLTLFGSGLLVVLCIGLIALNHYVWAIDATGLSLTIVGDDTSAATSDTSTTNGRVPVSGGQLTYRWGWTNVPGGGSVRFAQTLPVGVTWNAASITGSCSVSGSYLTTGETLTCDIAGLTDIPGTTDKIATVKNVTNNTVITSKLVSGSQQSSTVSVTASSVSQVQAAIGRGTSSYVTDAKDPNTGLVSGIKIPFGFGLYVPSNSTDQIKGQEALESNYSFTITVPSNAQLAGCGTDSQYQSDSTYLRLPSFKNTASTNVDNVANSGTINCTQSGSTVTVTMSGGDTTLNRVPNYSSSYWPARGYFAVAGLYIWMPGSSFSSTATNVTTSLNAFTMDSSAGTNSTTTTQSTTWPLALAAFGLNQYSTGVSNSSVYASAAYYQQTVLTVPAGSGQSATNSQVCQVWDPGLQRIRTDLSTPLTFSGTNISSLVIGNFTVEYGTAVYADDAARRAADCGTVGDSGTNWYSSITAAGGASEVSAVRIRYNRSLDPGQLLNLNVNVNAPTNPNLLPNAGNPTGTTTLPFFANRKSDTTAIQRLTTGQSSFSTLAMAYARDQKTSTAGSAGIEFLASDVKPGGTVSVKTYPYIVASSVATIADGRTAYNAVQTITLPNGCFTYVPGSPAPSSVTPTSPATPGTGQTCADMAGQVIKWNLGNIITPNTTNPIAFAVNINPATPTPVVYTTTALISSDSDKIVATSRTTTATVNVSTINQFQVAQTASSASVTTGTPFTYRAGWKNASSSDMNTSAYVVDVLPYVGDGRGTASLGSLTVNSVATSPGGLTVQYTTDTAATVQSQLASDQSGNTGISWTSIKPASGITAVRVHTQSLTAGAAGYMDISVTPVSFAKGGKLSNDINAQADNLSSGFSAVEKLDLLSSSSTISGNVYKDVDYSGTKNTGDSDIASTTVTLTGYNFGVNGINESGAGDDVAVPASTTATTDSGGAYSFTVSPGVYTVSAPGTQTVSATSNNLITSPAAAFEVDGALSITNKNFGYQEPISPPVAIDDSATIYQGVTTTVSVTSNDTLYVPSGVPATTIGGLTTPARGTAVLNANKTITYTANSVWPGSVSGLTYTASFQYTLTNPQGSSTATVTITVKRLPLATADSAVIKDNQTVDIDALANDYGDTLSFDSSQPPTSNGSGSASIVGGKLRFVPATHTWSSSETSYSETVTYHIVDNVANAATGQAVITIYRPPVVTGDSATIAHNSPTTISVLANDLVGKTPAVVTLVSQPATGVASLSGNDILFTPTSTQAGNVSFTYRVTDALGQSNTATVTIMVAQELLITNDGSAGSPVRSAQTGKLIDVLANDSGSSLTITNAGTPSHGTASVANGKIQYTPTAGYSGVDSFSYSAQDVLGASQPGTVYLLVIAAPTVTNDSGWTDTATTKDFSVLANDSYDASAVVTIGTAPSQGSASVSSGKIHYTPPASAGSTSLTYTVTDDVGQSATATLNVTIVAVFAATNDGSAGTPNLVPASGRLFDVLANDSGSALSLSSAGTPSHGTASISNGKIQYTPTAGYSGADSFSYSVTDQVGTIKSATVYIRDIAAPVLSPDSATTDSDTTVLSNVSANDTADASAVLAITSQPSHGTASIVAGSIQYVPEANYDGTVTIGYRLTDQLSQTASSSITITVTAAFAVRDDGSNISPLNTYPEGLSVAVTLNDSGLDLHVVNATQPAHGSVTVDTIAGTVTYIPSTNYGGYTGSDSYSYTASDSHGHTASAVVYLLAVAHTVVPTPTPTPTPTPSPLPTPTPITPTSANTTITVPVTIQKTKVTTPASGDAATGQSDSAVSQLGDDDSTLAPADSSAPATNPIPGSSSILLNDYHDYFATGKKLSLSPAQIIYFNLTRQTQTERHSVTVGHVGNAYVDVIIRSNPIKDRLVAGQSKLYDVDGNGKNDIKVTVRSISGGTANLTFKQLAVTPLIADSHTSFNWWWLLILLVPVAGLYVRRRYVKHRTHQTY